MQHRLSAPHIDRWSFLSFSKLLSFLLFVKRLCPALISHRSCSSSLTVREIAQSIRRIHRFGESPAVVSRVSVSLCVAFPLRRAVRFAACCGQLLDSPLRAAGVDWHCGTVPRRSLPHPAHRSDRRTSERHHERNRSTSRETRGPSLTLLLSLLACACAVVLSLRVVMSSASSQLSGAVSELHVWAQFLLLDAAHAMPSQPRAAISRGAPAKSIKEMQAEIQGTAADADSKDKMAAVARSLGQIHSWLTAAAAKLVSRPHASTAEQSRAELSALRGLLFTRNGTQIHKFGDCSAGQQASAASGDVSVYSTQPTSAGIQLLLEVIVAVFHSLLVGVEIQQALAAMGASFSFGGVREIDQFVEALISVIEAEESKDTLRKAKQKQTEDAAPAVVPTAPVAAPAAASVESMDMFANLSLAPQQQQQQERPQAPAAASLSFDDLLAAGPSPSTPAPAVRPSSMLAGPAVNSSAASSAFAAPAAAPSSRVLGVPSPAPGGPTPKPLRPAAGGSVRPPVPSSVSSSAAVSSRRAPTSLAAAAQKKDEASAESVHKSRRKKAAESRKWQSVEAVASTVTLAPASEKAEAEAPAMHMEAAADEAALPESFEGPYNTRAHTRPRAHTPSLAAVRLSRWQHPSPPLPLLLLQPRLARVRPCRSFCRSVTPAPLVVHS